MTYQEYEPHPGLQPYIEKFWTLETAPSDPYPMEHLITPNGTEGLILSYQQPAQTFVLHTVRIPLPEAYVYANPDRPWRVITEGPSGVLGVFFKAGSLHHLFKTSMSDVVGQVAELQAFLGSRPIRVLLEKLADAKPHQRIALVEDFFSNYFCLAPCRLTMAQHIVHLIQQQQGRVSVESIAHQVGVSRRTIEKQFVEKVGLSPKFYSRMMRFTAVQQYLALHPHACWLDITHHFGYYDQSHLVKDFHSFAGSSPLAYTSLDKFLVERFVHPLSHSDFF